MRAIAALALLAVAFAAVSAKSIHKLQGELHLATMDPKTDLDSAASPLLTAAAIKYADIRKMFNDNVIKAAVDQGKPARRNVGTWKTVGARRVCNNGNCDNWGADFAYTSGGDGVIVAVLNPAANNKPETIDIEFAYNWASCQYSPDPLRKWCMTHLKCTNIGQADVSPCDFSSYFQSSKPRYMSSTTDLYNSAPSISQSDAAKYVKKNEIRVTKTGVVVVRDWYEPRDGKLDQVSRVILGTFGADAFIGPKFQEDGDYVGTLAKDVKDVVAQTMKSKVLTTQQIINKFFTTDNIDLARLQGAGVPVKKTIAAYNVALFTKRCNQGICQPWSYSTLLSDKTFGGEGSMTLTCSTPTDLSKAVCDVTMTMKGGYGWEYQTFAMCKAVGNSATKCNGVTPSFFGLKTDSSTGRAFWDRQRFVTDVVDADETFFTEDRVLSRWKYHGLDADNRQVVYTELLVYSTPLTDFGKPAKLNCLSKASVTDVMAVAKNKGLKNKIVLQEGPVGDMIKNAPYTKGGVEEAVVKIKGIGPVNVVYVSFAFDFTC